MRQVVRGKPHYVYTHAYPESMGGYVFYVGKGTKKRIQVHEHEARRGDTSYKCRVIRKIWRAGELVIKTKLAFFGTHEEAVLYEQALILLMKPCGHLTNITDGGEGTCGRVNSEETRRKMSLAQKGKVCSEEHRRNLSEAKKGRVHSEETRRKMSLTRKGKSIGKRSEEHCRNMSLAQKGRTHSEESRRNMSEAHKGKSGRPHSEEARRKISEARHVRETQKRERALLTMRYPVISSTDADWKQGVTSLNLWEVQGETK